MVVEVARLTVLEKRKGEREGEGAKSDRSASRHRHLTCASSAFRNGFSRVHAESEQ